MKEQDQKGEYLSYDEVKKTTTISRVFHLYFHAHILQYQVLLLC
jgi:hypothetical protein